jgi:hypothetical protein
MQTDNQPTSHSILKKGNLRGWYPQGNAFKYQPTLDDNPTAVTEVNLPDIKEDTG